MHDIVNNISVTQLLAPQTITSSAINTGNIDTQGADIQSVVVLVGAFGDTLSGSVKVDLSIQHADDDGTGSPGSFTACTDADVLNFTGLSSGVFTSINAAGKAQKRYVIDYKGGKRFVKVIATPTGLSSGGAVAMLGLRAGLHRVPAVNS